MQILEIIDVREDPPRGRIVFKIVEHAVHLIEFALLIYALLAQLIAVRLADGTVFVRPAVPDMRIEFADIVGLFLPNPENFVYTAFKCRAAQRENGKFLSQIVSVYHAEFLDGVRLRAVRPMRPHGQRLVRKAVVYNVPAVFDKYLVSVTHSALRI